MELWQALALGALQGVAELFPISSLAQTILIPPLLGWTVERTQYLSVIVAFHLATAIALVIFYWKDWQKVLVAFAGCLTRGKLVYDRESKFAWMLVAGTVFVGLAGLALDKHISSIFFEDQSKAWIVAAVLVVNGFLMLFADFMKTRIMHREPEGTELAPDMAMHAVLVGRPVAVKSPSAGQPLMMSKRAEDLNFPQATLVGAAQALALIPGISRSGVTIIGGLFAGLNYEEAARFAFMLATPVIALASLKKIPELIHTHDKQLLINTGAGSVVAFFAAYLSLAFLKKYFHTNRLAPFGYFCIIFGLAAGFYLKNKVNNQPAKQIGVDSSGQVIQQNAPTGG
jgi:undecaprenyl-diphosphatase